MPIVKLTQNFITNDLRCTEGKFRIEYCDCDLPGLYIEVRGTSQGQGTYYLRYKDSARKTCHQKIGRTKDMTLVDARTKAKALKAEITLGADPRGAEKARKEAPTFERFFEDHLLSRRSVVAFAPGAGSETASSNIAQGSDAASGEEIEGLQSWLTLQLRFLVFHGPGQLIMKGCRGICIERNGEIDQSGRHNGQCSS